jgi:hypothetical protein
MPRSQTHAARAPADVLPPPADVLPPPPTRAATAYEVGRVIRKIRSTTV